MPGRGPQTFKKRQKEQQRKEKQQEKQARRFARKDEEPGSTLSADEELENDLAALDLELNARSANAS